MYKYKDYWSKNTNFTKYEKNIIKQQRKNINQKQL